MLPACVAIGYQARYQVSYTTDAIASFVVESAEATQRNVSPAGSHALALAAACPLIHPLIHSSLMT